MNADHERYADWDAAYVLGALPPAEREEYERHIARCPECTRALAELLPMPGLLRRVDADDREALLAGTSPAAPPADLERRLVEAARAESADAGRPTPLPWWRRRRTQIAVGLAAAAAVVAAVVVPLATQDEPAPSTTSLRLQQTVASPLSATVALTRTGWGTRIDMTCFYAGERGSEESRDYGLYVIDSDGGAHEVSSWWAGPGEEARTTGSLDVPVDQLRTVEVRASDGRTVLLSAAL
jgi:hypothetical protein